MPAIKIKTLVLGGVVSAVVLTVALLQISSSSDIIGRAFDDEDAAAIGTAYRPVDNLEDLETLSDIVLVARIVGYEEGVWHQDPDAEDATVDPTITVHDGITFEVERVVSGAWDEPIVQVLVPVALNEMDGTQRHRVALPWVKRMGSGKPVAEGHRYLLYGHFGPKDGTIFITLGGGGISRITPNGTLIGAPDTGPLKAVGGNQLADVVDG